MQALAAAVGMWLVATPSLVDYDEPLRRLVLVLGAWIALVAVASLFGAARAVRWGNFVAALCLLVAPVAFAMGALEGLVTLLLGLVLAVVTGMPPAHRHQRGGGWRALRRR